MDIIELKDALGQDLIRKRNEVSEVEAYYELVSVVADLYDWITTPNELNNFATLIEKIKETIPTHLGLILSKPESEESDSIDEDEDSVDSKSEVSDLIYR